MGEVLMICLSPRLRVCPGTVTGYGEVTPGIPPVDGLVVVGVWVPVVGVDVLSPPPLPPIVLPDCG